MIVLYYVFLLLIIFLCLFLMIRNIKYSPKKFKYFLFIFLILFLLRNISLISLCLVRNNNILYYLKYLIYIDSVLIPSISLFITFIFSKSSKIKLYIIYLIMLFLMILYVLDMIISDFVVNIHSFYGFIFNTNNNFTIYFTVLLILCLNLIINISILNFKYSNKHGIKLLLAAILISVIEYSILILNMNFFPYPIISDLSFLIILDYLVGKYKK